MELPLTIIGIVVIALVALYLVTNRRATGSTPLLDLYSRDLTTLARAGKLDPVMGREREIHRVIQILGRRTKNNPVLIGESGVGKTAIVEELANRIARGAVPSGIQNKRLLQLDLSSLVAGTKYRGEFEKRLKGVMDEIIAAERNIIIFVDELHILAEAGEAVGAIDAADILKPALARGQLQIVGATTRKEYEKHVVTDSTLERRFQAVTVREPNATETLDILKVLRPLYERHHHVAIDDEALNEAIHLADKVLIGRYFPDKAIDIIDEAAAKVRLDTINDPNQSKTPVVTKDHIHAIINEWMDDQIIYNNPDLTPPEKH